MPSPEVLRTQVERVKRPPFWGFVTYTTEGVVPAVPEPMVRGYLAFQVLRKQDNPLIVIPASDAPGVVQPTALEGYAYGSFPSAEEAIRHIADVGVNSLESVARLHKYSYGRTAQMERILREGRLSREGDVELLEELYAMFGAVLGRLRAELLYSHAGQEYQAQTHQAVSGVVANFRGELDREGVLTERYVLPSIRRSTQQVSVTAGSFSQRELRGFDFLGQLGKMGNPFLRQAMRSQ